MPISIPEEPARGDDVLLWARKTTAFLRQITPMNSAEITVRSGSHGTVYNLVPKRGNSATDEGVFVENLGDGYPILVESEDERTDRVQGRTLIAGDYITIEPNEDDTELVISGTAGDGAIHVNLIGGTGFIFTEEPPEGYVEARSLKDADGSLDFSTEENTIDMKVRATSYGTGEGLAVYTGTDGDDGLVFRSLVAGDRITMEHDEATITITADGHQFENLGTGAPVLVDLEEDMSPTEFRTVLGRYSVVTSFNESEVFVDWFYSDAGGGQSVVKQNTIDDGVAFHTIDNSGTYGIAVDVVEDMIRLQAKAANVGDGEEIYKGLDSDEGLQFRTLTAGTNVTITPGTDTLEIAADVAGLLNGDKGDIVVSGDADVWTIDSGAVTAVKIATDAVTEEKIDSGAVTGEKINQMGAETSDLLQWNGSAWAPTAYPLADYEEADLTVCVDGVDEVWRVLRRIPE